jgi:hypothetical protein
MIVVSIREIRAAIPRVEVIESVAVGEYPTSGVRHQSRNGIWLVSQRYRTG